MPHQGETWLVSDMMMQCWSSGAAQCGSDYFELRMLARSLSMLCIAGIPVYSFLLLFLVMHLGDKAKGEDGAPTSRSQEVAQVEGAFQGGCPPGDSRRDGGLRHFQHPIAPKRGQGESTERKTGPHAGHGPNAQQNEGASARVGCKPGWVATTRARAPQTRPHTAPAAGHGLARRQLGGTCRPNDRAAEHAEPRVRPPAQRAGRIPDRNSPGRLSPMTRGLCRPRPGRRTRKAVVWFRAHAARFVRWVLAVRHAHMSCSVPFLLCHYAPTPIALVVLFT